MPFFTNFAVSQVSGGTVINSTTGTSLIVTGGRTISKPTNVKLVGGAFSPTPTANAVDSWSFRCDGTNWLEVSRALNMS